MAGCLALLACHAADAAAELQARRLLGGARPGSAALGAFNFGGASVELLHAELVAKLAQVDSANPA